MTHTEATKAGFRAVGRRANSLPSLGILLLFVLMGACKGRGGDSRSPVPVLLYHHVTRSQYAQQYSIPLDRLREHLIFLKNHGYTTVLSHDYIAYLEGLKPLTPQPVMLTFDDWTPDHFEVVRPTLNEFGFQGVFFIPTGQAQSEEERSRLRQLVREGHEAASHSVNHYFLTQTPCDKAWKCCQSFRPCSDQEILYELKESKRELEKILGAEVISFAWPGNFFNRRSTKMAVATGYRALYAVERQVVEDGVLTNRVGATRSPHLIYRTEISGHCDMRYFPRALATQRCCVVSPRKFYRHCVPQAV